jgi:hypothetical protein
MKMNTSQKTIVLAAILVLFALACSTFSTPPTGGDLPPTPDALKTVLADVANATTIAATVQAANPSPTSTQAVEEGEDASPTDEPAASPESIATQTPTITNTPSGYPTAIPLPNPQASSFYTCKTNCASDGSNHQTSFPEKIEVIYFRFKFTEFPVRAPYSRAWYKDGVEWVRYDCYWPGPEAGVEEITLTDPLGLPSGNWNVVITINGVQVLNKSLTIEGSWNQWTPPGHFNSCYGKR